MSLRFQVILHTLVRWIFLKHSLNPVSLFKNSSGKPLACWIKCCLDFLAQLLVPSEWLPLLLALSPALQDMPHALAGLLPSPTPPPISLHKPSFSATRWNTCPSPPTLAIKSLSFKTTQMLPLSWRLKKKSSWHNCPSQGTEDLLLFTFMDTWLVIPSWSQAA